MPPGQQNAAVMVGSQAMARGQTQQMQMETDDARVKMSTIDGFKTNLNYDKRENSGGIMVVLGATRIVLPCSS